jgi:hypothetical protein
LDTEEEGGGCEGVDIGVIVCARVNCKAEGVGKATTEAGMGVGREESEGRCEERAAAASRFAAIELSLSPLVPLLSVKFTLLLLLTAIKLLLLLLSWSRSGLRRLSCRL